MALSKIDLKNLVFIVREYCSSEVGEEAMKEIRQLREELAQAQADAKSWMETADREATDADRAEARCAEMGEALRKLGRQNQSGQHCIIVEALKGNLGQLLLDYARKLERVRDAAIIEEKVVTVLCGNVEAIPLAGYHETCDANDALREALAACPKERKP